MRILILIILLMLQNIYAEYLYDQNITTDTGEFIKANNYSKRFDGICVELKEDYVDIIDDSKYNERGRYINIIKKAKMLPVQTDKLNDWKYYDLCKIDCDFGGSKGIYRLYIFNNETLQSVYNKMRDYKNYISQKDIDDFLFENLVSQIPQTNFQEIIQTEIGYDGRRCYMYDKDKTLWIIKVGQPLGVNNFAFFQTSNGIEVLIVFSWGYDYD